MKLADQSAHARTAGRRAGGKRGTTRRSLARWRVVLLAVLVVATTGFGIGYFAVVYRPDTEIDRAAAHEVVKAASEGAVALLSYSPDTLSRDFANAQSRVTDDYLPYLQQFADQIVGPSAQRARVTTTATVIRAAVSELNPNSAVVLIFVRQKTASREKPDPVVTSSSLRVTLKKVNSSWLIQKFEGL